MKPKSYSAIEDADSGYWFVNEYSVDDHGTTRRDTIADGLTESEAFKAVDLLEKVQVIFTRGEARLETEEV